MFAKIEVGVAHAAFAAALASLLWESPVGVDWIPVLGPAMNAIFHVEGSSKEFPQYPRRSEDEGFWRGVFLVMYGALGSLAQFGGLRISKRTITRESLIFYSTLYGFFHMVIAVHHLAWSCNRSHGKLEIWRFDLPGIYLGTVLSALTLMYHAYKIGHVNIRTADIKDICYRKSVMDTATCSTFISFIAFLIANLAGIETSPQADRIWWGVTMYLVPVILVLGYVMK